MVMRLRGGAPRRNQIKSATSEEEEAGQHSALSAALASVDDYMEEEEEPSRRPDETGELGMPPKHKQIVIDGASVAFSHGSHKRWES